MAKLSYALNRMEKVGEVYKAGPFYEVQVGKEIIRVSGNGGNDDIATINVRRVNDNDDIMTDYFAGSYYDNISQAIRSATLYQ